MTVFSARVAAVVSLALVVPMGGAVAAAPVSRVWEPTQRISGVDVKASDPEVVVDSTGRATIVWRGGRRIQVRQRRPDGTLTAVRSLGKGSNPTVGVDRKRTVTVAWEGVRGSVKTASKPAGRAWRDTRTLSPSYPKGTHVGLAKGAVEPRLAVNEDGDVVVVWQYGRVNDLPDSGGRLEAAYKAAGRGWRTERVTSYSLGGRDHEVALHADGAVEVVFETKAVHSVRRKGNRWRTVVELDRRGYDPTVAVEDTGNVVAGWVRLRKAEGRSLRVAERPAGTAWGASTPFPATVDGYDFQLRLDDQGRTTAAWIATSSQAVRSATRVFGDLYWTAATTVATVSGDNAYLDLLRLVTNARGDRMLTWQASTDTGTALEFGVYGATRAWDSTTWTAPLRLTTRYPAQVDRHHAALGPSGVAMSVWDHGLPRPKVVEGRRLTP